MFLANDLHRGGRLWTPDPVLQVILDAIPNAAAIVDGNGRLSCTNTAWRALGSRTGTFGGPGSLVASDDHDGAHYINRLSRLEGPVAIPAHRVATAIQEALEGGSAKASIAYNMVRPEGELPFEVIVHRIPTPAGPLALVQHVDRSDREGAQAMREAATKVALELEAQRSALRRIERRMHALQRDLHAPLTPVALELHLLSGGALGPLTPSQRKAVDILARNVRRWSDMERASRQIPTDAWLPPGPVDLVQLGNDAVDARDTQAMQQGVRFVRPSARPLSIVASPDLLADVLDTLLARALAVTPSGGAVVLEGDAQDGEARLAVVDPGPGLSARELNLLFDPLQGDARLAYARQLVQECGGRLSADPVAQGRGAHVTLAFPLQRETAEART